MDLENDKKEKTKMSRKEIIDWWKGALVDSNKYLGIIVGPVIFGAIIGIWLDKKYNSEPWILAISVGFSFVISIVGLIKKVK